jgi:hypothetical protein
MAHRAMVEPAANDDSTHHKSAPEGVLFVDMQDRCLET